MMGLRLNVPLLARFLLVFIVFEDTTVDKEPPVSVQRLPLWQITRMHAEKRRERILHWKCLKYLVQLFDLVSVQISNQLLKWRAEPLLYKTLDSCECEGTECWKVLKHNSRKCHVVISLNIPWPQFSQKTATSESLIFSPPNTSL